MKWHYLALFLACSASSALTGCKLLDNPCTFVRCGDGNHCEPVEIHCEGKRCLNIAECVADEPLESPGCEAVLCIEGAECKETDDGPVCTPIEADPCADCDCPPATVCEVIDGEADCVDVELTQPSSSADLPSSCAAVLCLQGTYCVEDAAGAHCVPVEDTEDGCSPDCPAELPDCQLSDGQCALVTGVESCAEVDCPDDTYCDDSSGSAVCTPLPSCDEETCATGFHCELEEVLCLTEPCPPLPTCLPDAPDPCAELSCAAGTHCELVDQQCLGAPCDPVAECIPDSM